MGILRRNGRVQARVKHGGRQYGIGSYASEEEARAAIEAEYEKLRDGTSHLLQENASVLVDAHVYASTIGVPEGTLGRWISEGLPVLRLSGKAFRIDPEVADQWVAEHHPDSVAFGRESQLYFARRSSDGVIKIGWTSDVVRRVKELRKEYGGVPFVLLAAIPGDKPRELALHRRFDDERIDPDDELFRPSERLLAFIQSIGQVAA